MAPGILIPDTYDSNREPHAFIAEKPTVQPDISWVPSFQNYMERSRDLLKSSQHRDGLPLGFPTAVHTEMAWEGSVMTKDSFVQELTADDINEIEAALQHFKGLNLPKDEIAPKTFPLANLSTKLAAIAVDVHQGKGCVILRGLNPSNYSMEDNVILYAGVASYIGEKRGVQNEQGTVLTHIKDLGADFAPDDIRQSPYANNAQPFHNDTCDVLCMYAMDRAKTGGRSVLAPVATVYNDIAASRPDVIHTLAEGAWPFDGHTDPPTYFRRPLLFHDKKSGQVYSCFSRRPLTGSETAPRLEHLPPLTEAQAEALDAVHFTALKHSVTLQLERGDMHFVNNLAILHAREAFSDDEDKAKRHLIRIWVRNETLALPTPDALAQRWDVYYGGNIPTVWDMAHSVTHVVRRKTSCIG